MSDALLYLSTYTTAAKQDNQEGLQNSSHSHHPSQPKEENDPEDILHAWQIHPHQGAHAGWLGKKKVDIHYLKLFKAEITKQALKFSF